MKQKLLIITTLFMIFFPFHTYAKENPYKVNINLWQGKLEIKKNGLVIESFPIASGKKDTPSPVGIYRVISKDTGWGGGFGSCWLGLNVPWGTYGIHGTNRPELIGMRVSGGCFRMKNRNVEKVFAIIPIGTPVVIDGPITGNKDITYRILVNGSRGAMVMYVQNHLKAMGIYNGPCDGIFGNDLEEAVAKYQKLKNFEVTKQIGLKELKDLDMIE